MAHGEARHAQSRPDQGVLRLDGNLEALPCAALLIDLNGMILDCNARARHLFRGPGHVVIGRRFPMFEGGTRTTPLGHAVADVRRSGARLTIPEITLGPPDQAIVIVRVTVAPVNAGGRVAAVLITAEERTDIASLHAERDQLAGEVDSLADCHQTVEHELSTTAEELRVANEELTAANESLQANAVELEAAQTSDRRKSEFLDRK